ncbi:uncharacterized protein LOC100827343 [Brachypodium distachyon]|uniref:Pollen Ole e 1 allergen and extensin family protein n=1 Tax=Brachypodium distachyon TaxID=15368 RepID=I1IXJ3_BRADI|nr:uncharacterized protein LOC100827343 [Brachypodium distachyon]KQJ82529.1 hypothetical protein BRADI_5g09480v3 [Brachypodium distachyon]|eukprot:XP_003581209.1 uncharacterized protein LOC100827343 [Brachypodium distachyon]
MAALRVSFVVGALVLCLAAAQIAAAGSSDTLRGTVACLDCAQQRNLSGVVVAVKCANGTGVRAAETDGQGRFEVAVPASRSKPGSPCAARILGGPEQLCAPPRFAASRVVVAHARPGGGSYALTSPLGVFTQCGSATAPSGEPEKATTAADAPEKATTAAGAPEKATTAADAPETATAAADDGTALETAKPVRLPGIDSPLDYNMGLPLNLFFPFFPVVGGGVP